MSVPLLLCTREHLFRTVCFGRASRTWRHGVQSWRTLRRGALPRPERRSEDHRDLLGVAGQYVGSPGHQHPSPRSDWGGGHTGSGICACPGSLCPQFPVGATPGDPVCCGCDKGRPLVNHHCGSKPGTQNQCDSVICPPPRAQRAARLCWENCQPHAGSPLQLQPRQLRQGWQLPGPPGLKPQGSWGREGTGPRRSCCSQSESEGHAWGEADSAPGGVREWAGVPPRPKDQSAHCSGRPTSRTKPGGHKVRWRLPSVCSRFRAVPNDAVKPCPREHSLQAEGL